MTDAPKTPAQRVRASEDRKVAKGGRRLPGTVIGAKATMSLEALLAAGYAASATACIERALEESWPRYRDVKASIAEYERGFKK